MLDITDHHITVNDQATVGFSGDHRRIVRCVAAFFIRKYAAVWVSFGKLSWPVLPFSFRVASMLSVVSCNFANISRRFFNSAIDSGSRSIDSSSPTRSASSVSSYKFFNASAICSSSWLSARARRLVSPGLVSIGIPKTRVPSIHSVASLATPRSIAWRII